MSWGRVVQRGFKSAFVEPPKTIIKLSQLPRTALPSDVLRMLRTNQLENVSRVSLVYDRFKPTGKAYVSLGTADSLNGNLRLLQKATLTSFPVDSWAGADDMPSVVRRRGAQGRQEAVDRGLVSGNGPDGGIVGNGKVVILFGLPGRLEPDGLGKYLKRFEATSGQEEIRKVERPVGKLIIESLHMMRCASVSDAHRLVRLLHMTYYNSNLYGHKYLIRARVIY